MGEKIQIHAQSITWVSFRIRKIRVMVKPLMLIEIFLFPSIFLITYHIISSEDAFNLGNINIVAGYGNTNDIQLTIDFQLTNTTSYLRYDMIDNIKGDTVFR